MYILNRIIDGGNISINKIEKKSATKVSIKLMMIRMTKCRFPGE